MKKFNKKGVFGLTSVQAFFAIILGVALLAYVIVVIMGTLSDSTILPKSSLSGMVANETGGWINSSGYLLSKTSLRGFKTPVITAVINTSDGVLIAATKYSVNSAGLLTSLLGENATSVSVSYTYMYNAANTNNADAILQNTSNDVSGFFGSINPVYAILAILVIILVLIVLVRVVTGGEGGGMGRREFEPQL